MQKVNILGINFSFLNKRQVLEQLQIFLQGSEPRLVVTPNAEFILAAQHDEEFFHILNEANMAVLDGSGPQFGSWVTGNFLRRYPGAELVKDLLRLGNNLHQKVVILNWRHGLSTADDIAQAIKARWSNLDFEVLDIERDGSDLDLVKLAASKPSILVATLGAPFQEKILFHNLQKLPSLRIAIGVGGALDFLTGKIRRAPKIFQLVGIEWLWRLLKQPTRLKRIWNATAVFVYKFIRWQFILPFFYRPNVACMLYKKVGHEYFLLLVERVDQPGHWQLPQGGTDGQSAREAGVRELEEELGINKLGEVTVYNNVWRYRFSKAPKTTAKRHSGYKGQKQALLVAEYLGADEDFKINFWDHSAWQWVRADKLLSVTYEARRVGYQKFLDLFYQTVNHENR